MAVSLACGLFFFVCVCFMPLKLDASLNVFGDLNLRGTVKILLFAFFLCCCLHD